MNKVRIACVGLVGMGVGVALTTSLVAFGATGDACDASYSSPMDSTQKLKQYDECRFDRLEAKVNALQPGTSVSPSASSSSTATASASATATPTTSASASASATATTPPASSKFPDATNTGVPSGVVLSNYTGPLVITVANTVIDAKKITGDLVIRAAGVRVSRSSVVGRLVSNTAGASVTVDNSVINGGSQETFPTVSYARITLRAVEVLGGQHSVQCSQDCTIENSWLHGQYIPANSAGHVNAFISNGGGPFLLKHNTIHCTVSPTTNKGGCTADASLFGDFGPIHDVTFDNNLFKSNSTGASYCLHAGYNPTKPYGSNPTRVAIVNNVFERGSGKCGIYGPVTSFLAANGNTWTNNQYADGVVIRP